MLSEMLMASSPLLGRLTFDAIPTDVPIVMGTLYAVSFLALLILALITWKGWWGILWRDWITSVDHKKIGIMYIVFACVMLLRGMADALMMRFQQALAFNGADGFLPPDHFQQIFTAHGVIMIFFVAMPFITGLMNYVVPLQIGARDVAFPFLNNFSFWMTVSGGGLIMVSLFVGEFAKTGWLAFPPLSETSFSPGVGVDYYIWGLQIAGIGTLLSGINLVVTILKMRTQGMILMRMPVFTWSALCTNILIVASFPVLTAVLALLTLDRALGFHFFTNDMGGNAMMYVNLIWIWGHPEVYILILPAFGIYSEVIATFSRKPLFGYRSMVLALLVITILSYMVWLHHFFTMGAGGDVNAFFGITTMIIAVPTGVKMFNWLFTMYRGKIQFSVPMLWSVGFMLIFIIGGMTGVMLASPPADFLLHNSLFLVAHFHNAIIGGVVFGAFAGINYWFPKAFGFRLHEGWGRFSFACWFFGFLLAFMPLYLLGLKGITRRTDQFDIPDLQIWFVIACAGAVIIFIGIISFLIQLYVSVRARERLADTTGDPWNGRTLEWMVSSPPPEYNFAISPHVTELDVWWGMKQKGEGRPSSGFSDIELPTNTGAGAMLALLALIMGFAVVWEIWWLSCVALFLAIGFIIVYKFREGIERFISSLQVREQETLIRAEEQHG